MVPIGPRIVLLCQVNTEPGVCKFQFVYINCINERLKIYYYNNEKKKIREKYRIL